MKRWLMLFTAVIAISLVSGCKQDTSDDVLSTTFVEGWWQCDFQAGNYMWVKYNAEKIGVKCLTKANNIAEVTDVSNTLQSDAFYYNWDTMKTFTSLTPSSLLASVFIIVLKISTCLSNSSPVPSLASDLQDEN